MGKDYLYFMWIFSRLNESAMVKIGAGGGTRTHTTLPSRDFKSFVSKHKYMTTLLIFEINFALCKILCKSVSSGAVAGLVIDDKFY